MRISKIIIRIIVITLYGTIIFGCSDELECNENAEVSGECFKAEVIDYDKHSINGSIAITREYMTIAFNFPASNSERYALTIRSNNDGSEPIDGMEYLFVENVLYETENSFRYNGNLNSNTIGELTVTFTKVDRTNGMVSGSFTFTDLSDQFGEHPVILGNFSEVNVALQQ